MAEKPVAEWIGVFNAAQVMCAPINDLRQAFDDPQVRHRGMRVEAPHDQAGAVPLVRTAAVMSETPLDRYVAPPRYGQHTREVLAARLSLTPDQIDELFAAGVLA
jgi:crotonobetainyl-CoA:carnitine CoA-transferase CaiB-like acyl-CoA transferase